MSDKWAYLAGLFDSSKGDVVLAAQRDPVTFLEGILPYVILKRWEVEMELERLGEAAKADR